MFKCDFVKKRVTILCLLLPLAGFLFPSAVNAFDLVLQRAFGAGVNGALGLSCSPTLRAVQTGGTAPVTVRVTTAPDQDLTVALTSNNPDVATVPDSVTILAGQTSATATVTGVALGSTYVTASTDAEQASCSVYVGSRFSGDVVGLATTPVRIYVGEPNPTFAVPVRVNVDPLAITQPVKVRVAAP